MVLLISIQSCVSKASKVNAIDYNSLESMKLCKLGEDKEQIIEGMFSSLGSDYSWLFIRGASRYFDSVHKKKKLSNENDLYLTVLEKKCPSIEGFYYFIFMGVVTTKEGEAYSYDMNIKYSQAAFLEEKRKFSINKFKMSPRGLEEIIEKYLSRKELSWGSVDEYFYSVFGVTGVEAEQYVKTYKIIENVHGEAIEHEIEVVLVNKKLIIRVGE